MWLAIDNVPLDTTISLNLNLRLFNQWYRYRFYSPIGFSKLVSFRAGKCSKGWFNIVTGK